MLNEDIFCLAGIGSTINVFDKTTHKILQRLVGLYGQKIYGIVPSNCGQKLLVFGGKQFMVASITSQEDVVEEKEVLRRDFEAIVCDDWIHSAVWIDGDVVALLTAHNVIQVKSSYFLNIYT